MIPSKKTTGYIRDKGRFCHSFTCGSILSVMRDIIPCEISEPLIHLHRFDTRAAAQNAVFAYIESFYNNLRPHSAIGWVAPNGFAKRFSQAAVA